MTKPINPKVLAKQRKENVPEILSMPLGVLMGKKMYLDFRRAGAAYSFMHRSCRNMSKKELQVVIGYFLTLRMGVK